MNESPIVTAPINIITKMPDLAPVALTFRQVGPDDEPLLFALFAAIRSEELQLGAWDPAQRAHMLQMQFEAQRAGYRLQFPGASERLILHDEVPVGWVVVDRDGPDLHGIDIALLPAERSRGIGSQIICNLQQEAAADGRAMVITVQRFNQRALALYARLGFEVINETDLHIVMRWRRE
jgi:ribosomal protein S18 acetylase RimI-like enzyme